MKVGITIEQMAAEIMRQNQAKADYVVDTRHLEMSELRGEFTLRIHGDNMADIVEPLDVNNHAHRQMGTHFGIPASYYDRMVSSAPDLLSYNLNTWFFRQPARRMIRTLDGKARAFLSDRYRRIDNWEILQAVLPILEKMPGAIFESCEVTESRMYIKVVNPRIQAEIDTGDVVQAGIVISNSETGQGSVSVQPLVYRLVCKNGLIINDAGIRAIHTGRVNTADENYLLYSNETLKADDRAFLLKVQDTVEAAVNEAKFSQVIDIMREAKTAKMNTDDIPGVVKLASRDFKLLESEESGILSRLIEDHDFSLFGLSNAVTRYSQDVGCYDRATKLESIGYNILTMGSRHWNRLNAA